MATVNSSFLNSFPRVKYDMSPVNEYSFTEEATDIFFRIGIIKNALNNINSYHVYEIQDGETPEIIAEKVYGDSGVGWMVIYANSILDPQFDWPLTYTQFQNYIKSKYGSIESAKTGIHHYEKVVTKTNSSSDVETVSRFIINKEKLTVNNIGMPFSYFVPLNVTLRKTVDSTIIKADNVKSDLTADNDYDRDIFEGSVPLMYVQTVNIDGQTVTITISGNSVSYYDYEEQLNENKRFIKVIKREYYPQIMSEFDNILSKSVTTSATGISTVAQYIRRLSV